MKRARLIGTGSYLPERVLTNQDLEKMVETSDEWIVSRTGIKERRIAAEDQATSDMAIIAAQRALEDAGMSADAIDLILVTSVTPDRPFPHTAAYVQKGIGATKAGTLDLQVGCSGFIYALAVAKGMVEARVVRNVLLIAADKLSSIVNWEDRNTCVLFGDGAGATVVAAEGAGLEIRHVCLGSDGCHTDILQTPAGGSRLPASHQTVEDKLHFVQMQGREVFRQIIRRLEESGEECLNDLGMDRDQISWIVPHQANIRIIESFAKRFEVPMERVYVTIHKYGNTSASSALIALDELRRTTPPKVGENLLLFGFGAGLAWGTAVITECSE
jgi:3-oxoacyl-[acyl-carrier-protein] synthase III